MFNYYEDIGKIKNDESNKSHQSATKDGTKVESKKDQKAEKEVQTGGGYFDILEWHAIKWNGGYTGTSRVRMFHVGYTISCIFEKTEFAIIQPPPASSVPSPPNMLVIKTSPGFIPHRFRPSIDSSTIQHSVRSIDSINSLMTITVGCDGTITIKLPSSESGIYQWDKQTISWITTNRE